jgi:DNA-binding NtrC family response regulator
VIAATHQPIEKLVEEGRFREDLYFRLKVVEIHVPPLRERREDIPLLAGALLGRIRRETHQTVRHISDPAMEMLAAYDWPGNVRELENALTRAAILARGAAIGPEHLSLGADLALTERGREAGVEAEAEVVPVSNGRAEFPSGDLSLATAIARHVGRVLEHAGGNKSETARILGISRSRLQRYVDKFDLEVPE